MTLLGVQNRINPIEKRKPNHLNRTCKKSHFVRMYSDHFFTQPHGLVRFVILILSTAPNQTAI